MSERLQLANYCEVMEGALSEIGWRIIAELPVISEEAGSNSQGTG